MLNTNHESIHQDNLQWQMAMQALGFVDKYGVLNRL
jgi:hypothetical protein